jgi:hypothetical protein
MNARKRIGLGLMAIAAGGLLFGATPELHPRVTREPVAHAPVPPECYDSLAPSPSPRVSVAEIAVATPVAYDLTPPPRVDLRTALGNVRNALRQNDRPAFDAGLADTRALIASHPEDAERRAAVELLRIYDDAAIVWNAQFHSPFFDQTSPLFARMRAYPGWEEAVRRGVLADDRGVTFYPAAESRAFLASLASDRLARLGIQPPAPPRRPTRVATTTAERPPTRTPETRATTPRTTGTPAPPSRTTTTAPSRTGTTAPSRKTTTAPSRTQTASTATKPAPPKKNAESPSPATATMPAGPSTSKPASQPPPPRTTPTPAPVIESPESTTIVPTDTALADAALTTDTMLATDAMPRPTTTETTSETAATETAAAAAEPSRTRSIIVPTILILIGLGVLIVLFRASK